MHTNNDLSLNLSRTTLKGSLALLSVAITVFVACSGGGSGGNPVQGASPGGIWRGTDAGSGLAIVALVDENGHGDFIRADNAQFLGQVSTSGNAIAAAGDAYASTDSTFPDGSTHGRWKMSGTINERQSIGVNIELTTDAGTPTGGALELTFDALYDVSPSLVEGTYTDSSAGGLTYYIASDGSFSFSELICRGEGALAVIDPSYNLYEAQLTTTCDNGTKSHVTGLATLDNTVRPERILVGFTGSYAQVLTLVHQ
jgi:hypothetical protein